MILCLFTAVIITTFPQYLIGQVSTSGDTTYVTGGTLAGGENAGLLESTINGDTLANGTRKDPNRVYALNEGQVYFQNAPINMNNPTGTLTIIGIPSSYGTTKPVWLMKGSNNTPILIGTNGCNIVYGSIKFVNIHYQAMQLDGTLQQESFYCGTQSQLPQSLAIDNCLFEYSSIDLFDCTNELALGTGSWASGWQYGAKFRITNSYFRNLFQINQWWGSRIFQCKHPIDTLWVENCTLTGGGLPFLSQHSLTAFAYFNHNTIVNNQKYWLFSTFYIELYVTNNIFINQNWVGEDTNVTQSNQDPDHEFMSTINIDTVDGYHSVAVQPEYLNSGNYTAAVSLNKMKVYVSNNINYSDPLLTPYYTNAGYAYDPSPATTPLSYLTWSTSTTPNPVQNIPCEWMNTRTRALFNTYAPGSGNASPGCGFVEENTSTANPNTITPGIADASVVTIMAQWNQNIWADPQYPTTPNITGSKYIFGDYDPTTIPGYKTENGSGITKFTDLTENFSQSSYPSTIDNLPIGALIWNDTQFAAYSSATDFTKVMTAYENVALPVQLASFTASVSNRETVLAWKTATEVSNSGFEIDRQLVIAQQWTKIGFVQGQGTSNAPHSYSYTDNVGTAGTYSYRLKQIDHNGAFIYSQAVQVTIETPHVFALSQNYPEPFNPSTMIQFTVPSDGKATLKVYNAIGEEVATLFNEEAAAGVVHQVQFNGSNLASGIYFSRLEFNGKMQVKKMLLLK